MVQYTRDEDDRGRWNNFVASYEVEMITTEYLKEWPRLTVPWQLFWLGTHYDDVQTQFEFITIQYDSDYAISKSYFTRNSSDGSDRGYWFEVRVPKGFTIDEIKQALVIGYYTVGAMIEGGLDLAFDGTTELSITDAYSMAAFKAIETKSTEGDTINYKGTSSPTIKGSGMAEDSVYTSIYNPTEIGDPKSPFKFETAQLSALTDPTAPEFSFTDDTIDTIDKTMAVNYWLDNLHPKLRLEAINITAETWKLPIFDYHNPEMVTEDDKPEGQPPTEPPKEPETKPDIREDKPLVDKSPDKGPKPPVSKEKPKVDEPKRESSLNAETWSKSENPDELKKYVSDLEKEIAYFREIGKTQQISNREKTIARVKELLQKLEDGTDSKGPTDEEKGAD
jgi:hypothetical protein